MSRVTEIRYVGYGVSDLASEWAFYKEVWGLKPVAERDGMVYLATEGHDELYVVRLRAAQDNRLDVVGLAADSRADVDALHERVVAAKCQIIFAPKELHQFGGGYGFRFFSPEGFPIEVSSDVERGASRELQRWEALPQRISHIVFQAPNQQAFMQFFIDVLGFKLSDWIGDFMGFLQCNGWHHRVAVLPGPPCLNHVAYDMLGIDDMMRGGTRVQRKGQPVVWGPGRHTVGDNTFFYFRTPSDFLVEYTAELEKIDPKTHQPQVHGVTLDINERWGTAAGTPKATMTLSPDKGLFIPAER